LCLCFPDERGLKKHITQSHPPIPTPKDEPKTTLGDFKTDTFSLSQEQFFKEAGRYFDSLPNDQIDLLTATWGNPGEVDPSKWSEYLKDAQERLDKSND